MHTYTCLRVALIIFYSSVYARWSMYKYPKTVQAVTRLYIYDNTSTHNIGSKFVANESEIKNGISENKSNKSYSMP